MEKTNPTLRLRGNFKTTTKGVYSVDVTAEIGGIDVTNKEEMQKAMSLIEGNLSELHDKVKDVAESKGYKPEIVEQK